MPQYEPIVAEAKEVLEESGRVGQKPFKPRGTL